MQEVINNLIYTGGYDQEDDPVLVVTAELVNSLRADADSIVDAVYTRLNDLVQGGPFSVVLSAQRTTIFTHSSLLAKGYRRLDYTLKKQIKAVFILFPDWLSRATLMLLLPMVSPKFFAKVFYVDSISKLPEPIAGRAIAFPVTVYEREWEVQMRARGSRAEIQAHVNAFPPTAHALSLRGVHRLLYECAVLIQQRVHTEGLFRRSPSKSHTDILWYLYENDFEVPLASFGPVAAASLVKRYYRSMDKPLFSAAFVKELEEKSSEASRDAENTLANAQSGEPLAPENQTVPPPPAVAISCINTHLDTEAQNAALYFFSLLHSVSTASQENLMDPWNLAVCVGPTLVPSDDVSTVLSLRSQSTSPFGVFLQSAIEHYRDCFPKADPRWEVRRLITEGASNDFEP
ncbi:rho-type GTPase activating protein [Schizosaccharomyces japonicus yFS275]|uniref:Rho-type GTPase activating protein n=1 Tax=Schizosaccharomyces japonicus (strain yFS275 / FY16936) TaxID=402676 RepID=B6K3Z1_SCHJY|nr:rho-type GTPase activating protein [Schizosaccharomyces japonicus yFS275]EEB08198.1 rho-type GTPase activating protein [Schizosaccharomyces japonicus yFS275]